jgi:hypothetical protein
MEDTHIQVLGKEAAVVAFGAVAVEDTQEIITTVVVAVQDMLPTLLQLEVNQITITQQT